MTILAAGRKNLSISAAAVARVVFFAALLSAILYRLSEFGLENILANLPDEPGYYILFAAMYFALPASEVLIYEPLWRTPARALFPVLIRKRVLNEGVLGYSGEAYLGFWARRHLALSIRQILSVIKDINLVSSFASLTATISLVFVVLLLSSDAANAALTDIRTTIVAASAFGAAAIILAYAFHRTALSLEGSALKRIAAVHFVRLAVVLSLQVVLWSVVLPDVPWSNWLIVLTAQLIVTRIPFMPSYDLILLGLGLSMSGVIGAPETAVAGLFVAGAALSLTFNLVMLLATAQPARDIRPPAPE